MKGIVCTGCSYTWGQGLYFYSNLPNLTHPSEPHIWESKWVTDAHSLYKDTLRYPRLVANYFNTFEVVQPDNGGCELLSLAFLREVFGETNTDSNVKYKIKYNDVSHIILQFSQPFRNYFPLEKVIETMKMLDRMNDISENEIKSVYKNIIFEPRNLTTDNIEYALAYLASVEVEKQLKHYEKLGIKSYILNWVNDMLPFIKNNKWLMDRLITFEFNGNMYDTIEDLQWSHESLTISTDYQTLGVKVNDEHPSKRCHEVIAEAIINRIERDNE